MNKLTALYSVMKNLKEMKENTDGSPINGNALLELRFGETLLGAANGKIECADGKCVQRAEVSFGEESMKFERSGSSTVHCCEMGHTKQFHHPMGHTHHGRKFSKLNHAMLMIKLIDKTDFETLANGQNALSLELSMADLPENMKAAAETCLKRKQAMLKKIMDACADENLCEDIEACCEASCCDDSTCCGHDNIHKHLIETLKKAGMMTVDPSSITPEKISIRLLMDEAAKPISLDMAFTVHMQTTTGEVKPLHLSFTGKML